MEVSRSGNTVFIAGREEGPNGTVGWSDGRKNLKSWLSLLISS